MQKGETLQIRKVNLSKQQEMYDEISEIQLTVAFMDFWRDKHFLNGTIRDELNVIDKIKPAGY